MTRYGKIVLLLNETQVLLQIDQEWRDLSVGKIITVFSSAKNPELSKFGIDEIYSPKGKLQVSVKQSDDIFLAEVFEEGGRVETRPRANFADIFNEQVVIGATRSADIKQKDTLGLTFSSHLTVGDIVGAV